ncbi:MAG: TonB family protein [Paludibacter sp.]|nr:TonB family protein [Paludibacter sp.]
MKKSELYGYIGTIISVIIIILLLFFVFLPGLKNAEDGGIMISFGESFEGAGSTEETTKLNPQTSPAKPEVKEELMTQADKSVVINNTKKTTETTQTKADDTYKKEQQASQQADDLIGGSFGASSNTGSGTTKGNDTAGNPVGSGTSGGNSWSLNGRNLLGTMPTPVYNQNIEGYITVEIRVDASGNVISTSVKKATISDQALRNAALNAAKRTRFSTGSGTVSGTITYNFKLR